MQSKLLPYNLLIPICKQSDDPRKSPGHVIFKLTTLAAAMLEISTF
jgi:hypothetical protein